MGRAVFVLGFWAIAFCHWRFVLRSQFSIDRVSYTWGGFGRGNNNLEAAADIEEEGAQVEVEAGLEVVSSVIVRTINE